MCDNDFDDDIPDDEFEEMVEDAIAEEEDFAADYLENYDPDEED